MRRLLAAVTVLASVDPTSRNLNVSEDQYGARVSGVDEHVDLRGKGPPSIGPLDYLGRLS